MAQTPKSVKALLSHHPPPSAWAVSAEIPLDPRTTVQPPGGAAGGCTDVVGAGRGSGSGAKKSESSSGRSLLVAPNSPICPHFLDVEGSPPSPSPQALQAMTSLQKTV